ncbi:hypothetical protein ACFFS2_22035 [Streptomyces aurantiacus]|uniref:Uncharacterized protein n=1 Tax=Streptomyces aurantiacus TaxID=47760 RepID=A0A7G1P9Q5_9ACTN|nr:hypothetical protein [Streptomyces aurantiacus]BCL30606.1 hypothetical protein GCM10017557_54650 [Streptomyces aurantiacus]
MANSKDPALPDVPRRPRAGLSAAELAAGLIAEESRSSASASAPTGSDQINPEFFRGPSARPTIAQRISRTAVAFSESSKRYLRRVSYRSTYADAIGRQNEDAKKEIGAEVWNFVKERQGLIKDLHNEKLPMSADLIEKSGNKVTTLRADTARSAPRLGFRRPIEPSTAPATPRQVSTASSISEFPDRRNSLYDKIRVAQRWLALNPENQENSRDPANAANAANSAGSVQSGVDGSRLQGVAWEITSDGDIRSSRLGPRGTYGPLVGSDLSRPGAGKPPEHLPGDDRGAGVEDVLKSVAEYLRRQGPTDTQDRTSGATSHSPTPAKMQPQSKQREVRRSR